MCVMQFLVVVKGKFIALLIFNLFGLCMREGNLKSSPVLLLELSVLLILSFFCCMEFEILSGACIFKIGLFSCVFIYLLFLASILCFVSVMS